MNQFFRQIIRKSVVFLAGEDGPTAVEYAVMLGLILMVAIGSISVVGGQGGNLWQTNSTELGTAMGTGS